MGMFTGEYLGEKGCGSCSIRCEFHPTESDCHNFATVAGDKIVASNGLQTWVDRLALQGEHSEDALMNTPQWFTADEPLQRFNPQSKFS